MLQLLLEPMVIHKLETTRAEHLPLDVIGVQSASTDASASISQAEVDMAALHLPGETLDGYSDDLPVCFRLKVMYGDIYLCTMT